MLAGNTIFSRVWVRRLLQFVLGAVLSHLAVVGLSPYVYSSSIVQSIVMVLIWPATFMSMVTADWERWGWAIVLSVLAVGVFWGLVAMAIGWGWERLTKKEK
jgi:hypothetical protein